MTSSQKQLEVARHPHLLLVIVSPVNKWEAQGVLRHLEKLFVPPRKMCWTYFRIIGRSLKNVDHSQKTLRSPGVPSWLWAGYSPNKSIPSKSCAGYIGPTIDPGNFAGTWY